MNLRLSMAVGAVLVPALVAVACLAADPEAERQPSYWMKKKLEYSEKILAGLADGDYDAIAKTARSMNSLTQMEKWVRGTMPEYRAQLQMFQNANQQLIRTAERENLDGAALAYVQLTLSCINCHKIVRDHTPKADAKK